MILGVSLSRARIAPPVRSRALQFEHLAEQDQDDNDGRGLEIDVDPPVKIVHVGGKQLGCQNARRTVEVCG